MQYPPILRKSGSHLAQSCSQLSFTPLNPPLSRGVIPFGLKLDTFEFLKLPIGKASKIQNRSTELRQAQLPRGQ
jgi:hypothetical protein